jgi:hypothetical protein
MQEWKEFLESGLLWFVNRQLHIFGWAIVIDEDEETGEIKSAVPKRTDFRGFSFDIERKRFEDLTKHMKKEIPRLMRAWEE